MALPSALELREYLRIEHQADNNLLDRLLTSARALVEAYIRTPIEARDVTVMLSPVAVAGVGGATVARRLLLPFAPIDAASVVVEDADGAAVGSSDYTAHAGRGWLTFDTARALGDEYAVTVRAGLSLRSDYAAAVEPVMSAAIIDIAADLYQRRNPAASYESGGGGVAVNYNETASKTIPSRIKTTLDPWRRVLV